MLSDVAVLDQVRNTANHRRAIKGSCDVLVTTLGITVSSREGHGATVIPHSQVKWVQVRKDKYADPSDPPWFLLTITFWKGDHHWWNVRAIGRLVLRNEQFDKLRGVLLNLPALQGKLDL